MDEVCKKMVPDDILSRVRRLTNDPLFDDLAL